MSSNEPSTLEDGKSAVPRADFEELSNKILQRLDTLGSDMSAIKKNIQECVLRLPICK